MSDEIVDLNGRGTFTRKQSKERWGLSETGVTKTLKALLDAGDIARVSVGVYKYADDMIVARAGAGERTADVPAVTLDDVMAHMDLGWLEGKAIELIAHHDSIADVEQAIGCLKSILKHQYNG